VATRGNKSGVVGNGRILFKYMDMRCGITGIGQKERQMLKVYSFEARREKEIPSEEILGIGLTDESMAEIVATAVQGPYMRVNRHKLTQMHWYLSQVSIMLIKLMLKMEVSELILPTPERELLGETYALGARETEETEVVRFTLANRLTGKEVVYGNTK